MARLIISVNEFLATCNWQVVGVQVEQNRCKDRASRKAIMLGSPSTGVIARVHPETSISKQQTHQSGQPIWHAFIQFVKKTSVPNTFWLNVLILKMYEINTSLLLPLKIYFIVLKHIKSLILLQKLVFISIFNVFILMFVICFYSRLIALILHS